MYCTSIEQSNASFVHKLNYTSRIHILLSTLCNQGQVIRDLKKKTSERFHKYKKPEQEPKRIVDEENCARPFNE